MFFIVKLLHAAIHFQHHIIPDDNERQGFQSVFTFVAKSGEKIRLLPEIAGFPNFIPCRILLVRVFRRVEILIFGVVKGAKVFDNSINGAATRLLPC